METKTIKKARLLYRHPLTQSVKDNILKVIEGQSPKRNPGVVVIGGEDCGPVIVIDLGTVPERPIGDPTVVKIVKDAMQAGNIKRVSSGGITTLTITQKNMAPIRVTVIER